MSKLELVLLALCLAAQSALGQFACPDKFPGCKCEVYDRNDVRLHCTFKGELEGYSYHDLAIHAEEYVGIRCGANFSWDHFLNGQLLSDIEPIKSVVLEDCRAINGHNLEIIKHRLGLRHGFQQLKYEALPDKLHSGDLDFLTDLKVLNLAENNLGAVDEDLLWGLPHLENLGLRSTQVSLPAGFFSRSKKLKVLELGSNGLKQLEPGVFDGLESINQIGLWSNELRELEPRVFRNLGTLRTLDLNNNELLELPVDLFAELKRLRVLDISWNNLTTLPKDVFRSNIDLFKFKMSDSKTGVRSLPSGLLADLAYLNTVEMKQDSLRSLPEDLLWNSGALEKLDVSWNLLTDLPPLLLRDAAFLEELNLAYNDLTCIPEGFFIENQELKVLDLSLNQFESINKTTFKGLRSLEELNMDDNKLSFLDAGAFTRLEKLRVVKLANNRLTMYTEQSNMYGRLSPLHQNVNLEELHLANNNVSELASDWIFTSLKLRKLNLYNNSLGRLRTEDLQFMSDNLEVDLRHNRIRSVELGKLEAMAADYQMVSGRRRVRVLLADNPFECDCKLFELLRYVRESMAAEAYAWVQLELKDAQCAGPQYASGARLGDFDADGYVCVPRKPQPLARDPCGPAGPCSCWFRPARGQLEVNCEARGLTEAPAHLDARGAEVVLLNLRHNRLTRQPNMSSRGYEKVGGLLLAGNRISAVDEGLLSPGLRYLELDGNRLENLGLPFLRALVRNESGHVNVTLGDNPWRCDCAIQPFVAFAQAHAALYGAMRNASCRNSTSRLLGLPAGGLCPGPLQPALYAAAACLGLLLAGAALAGLYCRFQLAAKVWLYSRGLCLCFITEAEVDRDKLYDAFLSYSHKDEGFVKAELLSRLEAGPHPYKLCIHERDWVAGEWIPTQIERSVAESKRTIIVLSRNFIESLWSKLEFQLAHKQALQENRCRVIVVLLDDVDERLADLDAELAAYLKTYTYVKWADPCFWQKLAYALPHRNKADLLAIEKELREAQRLEHTFEPPPDPADAKSCRLTV